MGSRPFNLTLVKIREVKLTKLGVLPAHLPGKPCGGKSIGIGRMRVIQRHPVKLTKNGQVPPSSAVTIHLPIEDIWVHHQQSVGTADSLDQWLNTVPACFPIKNGQVETRVESDDRHIVGKLAGKDTGDLIDRRSGRHTLAAGPLGGDPVHFDCLGRNLDARIYQPGPAHRFLSSADQTHGGSDDTVVFDAGTGGFYVEGGQPPLKPVHDSEGSVAPGRSI